jgi:hypothetical protein
MAVESIYFFDFDGTLAATATPEIGIPFWRHATGQPWPFQGWWGRPETLSPPLSHLITDGPALPDFFQLAEGRAADAAGGAPPFILVMMTGRVQKLAPLVEAWMSIRGVRPDLCLYGGGGPTLDVKVQHIRNLLAQHPTTTRVELWEDRPEHASAFEMLHLSKRRLGRTGVHVRVHRVGPAAVASSVAQRRANS